MNLYIRLINDTIDYIENNIKNKINLEDISKEFNVSQYHFNRIFKTVTGKTLKNYILGRKLTYMIEYLDNSDLSLIDIAFEFGFEYPEVFSRAFKKQFGLSPLEYKKHKNIEVDTIKKACVVERDIINFKGVLALKGEIIQLQELNLKGIFLDVDTNLHDFKQTMQSAADDFFSKIQELNGTNIYVVVNCHGKDNGEYTVFHGIESTKGTVSLFYTRIVPAGWYARFYYTGDMFEIREAFIDDLYRWVMLKEISLNQNGVGMLNIFEEDYLKTKEVQILIPIEKPM